MSAVPASGFPSPHSMYLERMQLGDVSGVLEIENDVYPHPWTRGNFVDSINSGYEAWIAHDASGMLIGYFLMMMAVDEAHLLNVSVRGDLQGKGFGRMLLDKIATLARELDATSILLEVRPSNERALAVYQHIGYGQVGRRKAYYPAAKQAREDAIVMRLVL